MKQRSIQIITADRLRFFALAALLITAVVGLSLANVLSLAGDLSPMAAGAFHGIEMHLLSDAASPAADGATGTTMTIVELLTQ